MTINLTLSLWMIVPAALAIIGLWLMFRRRETYGMWDFDVTPVFGLLLLSAAGVFLLGRCSR